ncbi:hypothetical protein CPB86DRAFT_262403 [Serendipita vermifera]|nr:hypothetical protein CPB86DRAFT_262403 [Serendipita vermifera]
MGVHGAGKTTFINYATGQLDKKVGNSLHADTRDIEFTKADSPSGQSVVLVDTPGFDSSTEPPVDTLTQIAEHLNKAYKKEIKIDTILYLHKISDNRMAGSVRESLKFFSTLCNQEEPPNVIFVTTMWGHVSDEIGDRREEQLKNLFWNDIITDDSQVKRFKDTYESALEILGYSPDDIKSPAPAPASEQNNDQKSRWTLSFSRLVLKARVRAAFQ